MLMGTAIFLLILVPAVFYLFTGEDSQSSPSSSDQNSGIGPSSAQSRPPEPVLRVASSDVSLLAVVNSSPDLSLVYLENNGITKLHRIKVKGRDRSLGTLSELDPGEKKVLSISGRAERVGVFALDPTGLEIQGRVLYNSTGEGQNEPEDALNKEPIEEMALLPMSIPAGGAIPAEAPAPAPPAVEAPVAEEPIRPPGQNSSSASLSLNLSVNRSAGLAGEAVSFQCLARNTGKDELSDVLITCGGKIASTRFLTPDKELQLDGVLLIENNTRLLAEARAKDGRGNIHANNSSLDIRMISPKIDLLLRAPELVHRGENASILIQISNSGEDSLTDLKVDDRWGEVARIPVLAAGEVRTVHGNRTILHTLPYEVVVSAQDEMGGQLYARQSQMIAVMNSSLEIKSERMEVASYPGEPAEVTWILSNTGQETLFDVTLQGDETDCILPVMLPNGSVRMAAIYNKNATTMINVTARGVDSRGFETTANGSVLLKSIQPGISLKIMPERVEAVSGDAAPINCLVTNSGQDRLEGVVLTLDGAMLISLGDLEPGEFRVVEASPIIQENGTLQFAVAGKDSLGRTWSDRMAVEANTVITAVKVFASASPSALAPGGTSNITCTVANTGSVPLYSIFVISKNTGPLGSIDFLSPKHQKTITAKKTISSGGEDIITAEGFTMDRESVRGEYHLSLVLIEGSSVESSSKAQDDYPEYSIKMVRSNISYGNLSLPFNLPEEESTITQVSGTMARDIDQTARRSNNVVVEGVSNLLRYVENLLGLSGGGGDDKDLRGDKGAGDGEDLRGDKGARDFEDLRGDKGARDGEEVRDIKEMGDAKEARDHLIVDDGTSNLSSTGRIEPIPMPSIKPESRERNLSGSENYELSIEGVKNSEHGVISILDVNAQPRQPAAGEDVVVTVHIKSQTPIEDASVKYGLSDSPLTRQSMMRVNRVYETGLAIETGDETDGYWSGTIPGRAAGTYMPLSIWITDGSNTAEGGPYLIHWSTVNTASDGKRGESTTASLEKRLFIESTSVKGEGEVSIKDNFNGAAMHYNDRMMGNGSISMETLRSIDRRSSMDNFTETKDLVFTGGSLKGHKTVESPRFDGGMGASVSERYNLSHVDRSESSSVSSAGYANNSLNFKTEQAFNGTWNIQTNYARLFKRVKADQQYKGSFQTEKDIQFQDNR
ncbi:MAG: hypothetical protein ACOX84_11400 [Methanothrix sp.]|uniref:hypothetical protein n=2 Tax=Methanothrix sp. TaxID=90426 RepID=UPI00345EA858